MKTNWIACLILLSTAFMNEAVAGSNFLDSLVIRFGNKTKLIIQSDSKAGIQSLSAYDLNKIVQDMGMKLDSVPNGQTYMIDEKNGQRYLRDTVLVITRNGQDRANGKNGNGGITVTLNRKRNDDTTKQDDDYRKSQLRYKNKKGNWGIQTDFLLGLNSFVGADGVTYAGGGYDLRPIGSRYFAIRFGQNPIIARNNTTKLSLRYGVQIGWNNFMFDENIRAEKGATQVQFVVFPEQLQKSKLTITSVEIPVMPQLSFYNAARKKVFHLGIGGFVGYRIDSYAKIKRQSDQKERDHGNFYLNDLSYGVLTSIGIARLDLFIKYNLNNTFQTGKGPDVQALSFGVTL